MGYESKLYIVYKGTIESEGKRYAHKIAEYDLCTCYPLSDILRHRPATDCYIYADDGDTMILEDRYGYPLTETTVSDVIRILERDIARGETYRRIEPLLAMLKVFEQQEKDGRWNDLVVLHYGY